MANTTVDRIKRVPLRTIWKHEASHFTTWLVDNMDVLDEVIGIKILNAEREQGTGNFYVDIKAEDANGNVVVIENQLEKSNHDHLGKVISYLASFEAKVAIWIVAEPRQEHINAINWLNQGQNGCDFYLLKIEGVQIGDSKPAPWITCIAQPSEEAKAVGKAKLEYSERHQLRYEFWTVFLERAKGKLPMFNNISPNKYGWIAGSSGKRGIAYQFWLTRNSLLAEVRIDKGKDSDEENLRIFNALQAHKEAIENQFGQELDWDESDGDRKCSIGILLNNGGYRNDPSEWHSISDRAIETMKKLEKVFKPYIDTV